MDSGKSARRLLAENETEEMQLDTHSIHQKQSIQDVKDVKGRLERLQELKMMGAISDEEYSTQRQKIIGDI